MFVAAIAVGAALVLFLLGLVAPRVSKRAERKVDKALEVTAGFLGNAPGPLGDWLAKPFGKTEKAANKSAKSGRKARRKAKS